MTDWDPEARGEGSREFWRRVDEAMADAPQDSEDIPVSKEEWRARHARLFGGGAHSIPQPNEIMNTPGLPGRYFQRPTFFPACLFCYVGECNHDQHGRSGTPGARSEVAAITIVRDAPTCGDCTLDAWRSR